MYSSNRESDSAFLSSVLSSYLNPDQYISEYAILLTRRASSLEPISAELGYTTVTRCHHRISRLLLWLRGTTCAQFVASTMGYSTEALRDGSCRDFFDSSIEATCHRIDSCLPRWVSEFSHLQRLGHSLKLTHHRTTFTSAQTPLPKPPYRTGTCGQLLVDDTGYLAPPAIAGKRPCIPPAAPLSGYRRQRPSP